MINISESEMQSLMSSRNGPNLHVGGLGETKRKRRKRRNYSGGEENPDCLASVVAYVCSLWTFFLHELCLSTVYHYLPHSQNNTCPDPCVIMRHRFGQAHHTLPSQSPKRQILSPSPLLSFSSSTPFLICPSAN